MNNSKSFSYAFRKSPVIRTLLWGALAFVFFAGSFLFSIHLKKTPVIDAITPPVGAPGDLIIISGKYFGSVRDTSYVEFGGNKLTSSSYLSWSDTEIKVVLPANIKDGLVIVETKDARSKPAFFSNTSEVPVPVAQNKQITIPIITGVTPEKITPGTLITISGVNFGNSRDMSKVFFSVDREIKNEDSKNTTDAEDFSFIEANEDNYDYVSWNDNQIQVYVPDGAASGYVYVQTAKGKSVNRKITMDTKAGKKSYISPKTYIIQLNVDIDETNGDKDSTIILRCPRPVITAAQPSVKLAECSPEPIITDFQHTIIHQTSGTKTSAGKRRFKQNFAVTAYETRTEISSGRLDSYSYVNKNIVSMYTKADKCVPSDDPKVTELAKTIVKAEKNPYNAAALIYNYMLKNFTLGKPNKDSLDLISKKSGDAYDFAMIYTALLRACGIPALPDSGILVSSDLKSSDHWWCEFFLPGLGWIPVDPALGAGLKFQAWQIDINPSQYYFGNLDGQHILFSRGWNEIKPSAPNNRTVHRSRSYALQSIWEEANGKVIKYSSYWSNPIIVGVY